MNFDEAEEKFRELQARVQRGEPISRAEYEEQVAQLAVQDERGVLWEINPRSGKWMYFDGAEWVGGTPPGRDQSAAAPMPRTSSQIPIPPSSSYTPPPNTPLSPTRSASAPSARTLLRSPQRPMAAPSSGARPAAATPSNVPSARAAPPASPDSIQPYVRVNAEQPPGAPPAGSGQGVPASGPLPPRLLRAAGPLGGPNREWVPLAIGAVVLLFCAILLFVGGRFALGALGPQPTSTTAARVIVNPTIPQVPTAIRLPTAVMPTAPSGSSPAAPSATVTAKVNEASVNVRQSPSTSAKILTKAKKGQTVTLVGKNEAGDWYQMKMSGLTGLGWIFGETIDISGDTGSLPVVGSPAPAPTNSAGPTPRSSGTATLTPIGGRP